MIYELLAEYCKVQLEKNKGFCRRIQKEELLEAAGGGDESCIRMIRVARMEEFERALDRLCRDQILSPVASSKVRRAAVPSYEKYLLNGKSRTKEYDSGYQKQLYAYPGTRVPEYYRAKKAEFEKDKGYLDRIYSCWQQKEKPDLTANELGFYLFHSEKAFEQPEKNKKSSGRALEVLNRMGLSLSNLGVRHAPEPFFHISYPGLYENRQHRVLITENKDTYYTVMEKMAGFGYDCVIFGDGKEDSKAPLRWQRIMGLGEGMRCITSEIWTRRACPSMPNFGDGTGRCIRFRCGLIGIRRWSQPMIRRHCP